MNTNGSLTNTSYEAIICHSVWEDVSATNTSRPLNRHWSHCALSWFSAVSTSRSFRMHGMIVLCSWFLRCWRVQEEPWIALKYCTYNNGITFFINSGGAGIGADSRLPPAHWAWHDVIGVCLVLRQEDLQITEHAVIAFCFALFVSCWRILEEPWIPVEYIQEERDRGCSSSHSMSFFMLQTLAIESAMTFACFPSLHPCLSGGPQILLSASLVGFLYVGAYPPVRNQSGTGACRVRKGNRCSCTPAPSQYNLAHIQYCMKPSCFIMSTVIKLRAIAPMNSYAYIRI